MYAARPVNLDAVYLLALFQTEMYAKVARRSVSHSSGHVVRLISDSNHRADSVAVTFRSLELQNQPGIGAGADIPPELGSITQRGGNDVDSAIPIEVGEGAAAMRAQ